MKSRKLVAAALTAAFALAACSSPKPTPEPSASGAPASSQATVTSSNKLTVVTHKSFEVPKDVLGKFASENGLKVEYTAPGDSGEMLNQLILSKKSPMGDVVFGIDNNLASRAIKEGIISPYTSEKLPASAKDLAFEGLTPIDVGDVCINADTGWFEKKGIPAPKTLDDLLDPKYKDLLVISDPAQSTPGLAFMLATIAAKGENGWLDYWKKLKANGVLIVKGWSEAYYNEFTQGGQSGKKPLVLSYASSPAFTVSKDGSTSSTTALLDTCYRQVEYAGVIKGAQNEAGAQKFIDFLVSDDVQKTIPDHMYMYPANRELKLGEAWTKFAPLAEKPLELKPADVAAKRDQWLKQWNETVLG